jgi:5-methyltetrahydrofolate--homocysteine methyltransferase
LKTPVHLLAEGKTVGVALIGRDQLWDYAGRRGMPLDLAEKYPRPNIGY